MLAAIADAYRRTSKPKDVLWNRYVARPLAAVLLPALVGSRITPNQVTFASLGVFGVACALLVGWPGHLGLIVAVAVLELSYVLDCVDGQLARLRGTSSRVGAHLDFLMDEIKAFLLVAATGARLWHADGKVLWLIEALVGLTAVASAISLTTFIRRPEYIAATGKAPSAAAGDYGDGFPSTNGPVEPARRSPVAKLVAMVESLGRAIIHYPSYLVFIAAFDQLPIFLHAYVAVNTAYAARTLLSMLATLGRPAR